MKLAHERNFVVNNTNYATPVESAVLDVFKHTTATFMLIPFRISCKMMMMFSKKLTKYLQELSNWFLAGFLQWHILSK